MPLSLKELRTYSAPLAVSCLAIALIAQMLKYSHLELLRRCWASGAAYQIILFVAAVGISIVVSVIGWEVLIGLDNRLHENATPVVRILLIAFGLTLVCRTEGFDLFPGVNPFWRLASLAYGLWLFGPEGDRTRASAHAKTAKVEGNQPPPPTPEEGHQG